MISPLGVFSDREILDARLDGRIVIDPFNPEHVKGSSYDVTLGEYYYRTEGSTHGGVYNPFDRRDVERYFGEPQRAISHDQYIDEKNRKPFKNIPLDHLIIVLDPGERILGHTHEFIGIRGNEGTTMMKARSSWGRNGVSVCHDAGWGDPGYCNRWTMEILNLNNTSPVVLPVGERVAQIVFFHTGEVASPYRSKYQEANSELSPEELLAEMKRTWNPTQMLPASYKDPRPSVPEIIGLAFGQ